MKIVLISIVLFFTFITYSFSQELSKPEQEAIDKTEISDEAIKQRKEQVIIEWQAAQWRFRQVVLKIQELEKEMIELGLKEPIKIRSKKEKEVNNE